MFRRQRAAVGVIVTDKNGWHTWKGPQRGLKMAPVVAMNDVGGEAAQRRQPPGDEHSGGAQLLGEGTEPPRIHRRFVPLPSQLQGEVAHVEFGTGAPVEERIGDENAQR